MTVRLMLDGELGRLEPRRDLNQRPAIRLDPVDVQLCWRDGIVYFAIAGVIDVVVGLRAFPSVLHGSLVNPDTYMRLVRLRDMLTQHATIDVVARDGGGGTLLYWSHLIDSLILLLAAPLSLFVGEAQAVHWAALAFGPIGIGLLGVAVAWAMAPFTHRGLRWLAPLLTGLSPEIVGYAVPGEVHHHIPMAVTCVMTAGWALRAPWHGAPAGWAIGAWAVVGIWLTPESTPFILAAFGGLGLFWLLHPESLSLGKAMRSAGTVFLVLIAAALAVDPPFAGYTTAEIDRLSIVYLALGAVVCAVGWSLSSLDRLCLPLLRRNVLGMLVSLVSLGLWFAAFPTILEGPNGLLNAQDTRLFFGVIDEMTPIRTMNDIMFYLIDGLLAAIVTGVIAWRMRSPMWGYAALCAGLTIILGVSHRRFATYPEIVAAAMLPVIASLLHQPLLPRDRPVLTVRRFMAILLFVLLPQGGTLADLLAPHAAQATTAAMECDPRALTRLLLPYAGRVVMTSPNDTPAVLYWSNVLTVGSVSQRNVNAFLRLRAAWRSAPSAEEPPAVQATQAALVLVCPRPGRSMLVAGLPADTLEDRLSALNPPPWLVQVRMTDVSGWILYRVAN
jgi:hypothetical protein